jgi:hypothetical protein
MKNLINIETDKSIQVNALECQRCKNIYILIWLAEAENYNDFGLRHCPFCGLLTDQITGSVMI